MKDADRSSSNGFNSTNGETSGLDDRDKLIASIYEAALDPAAYGRFVAALSDYLENTAVKHWNIRDLSEVDVGVIESDRGLAHHFRNLQSKLEQHPDRFSPGSLRERVANRQGIAVLLDPRGQIASSSRTAQSAFEDDRHFVDIVAERLHAEDAIHLRQVVSAHTLHSRDVEPRILRGDSFHLIARSSWCDVDRAKFLCLESLVVDWSTGLEMVLAKSFGLTPAELRVLQMLVAGNAAKTIAFQLERSEGTVRNQIKSILGKTESGGLANLNRVVALIADTVAGAPTLKPYSTGSTTTLDILTLPQGRPLEVRLQGPAGGRPVLFIHGMLFGSELPQNATDLLFRHNLRLIAPARPNFGMSPPAPGLPEDELDRLVEDLVFVLDHYGLKRTVCLTNIAGAVYGYALAASHPDRISGMVNAASPVPLLKARQFAAMPPTQRLIAFLMRFSPSLLVPLLQSGIAQIRASGEGPFLTTLYQPGTRDHSVTQRSDLIDLLSRSVHFCTDQGYLGAYTDTLNIVRDWSHYVARVGAAQIPSIHVHGHDDPQYMFDDVVDFTARFDSLELRGVRNAGQLVLFDQPAPVFEAVAELVD